MTENILILPEATVSWLLTQNVETTQRYLCVSLSFGYTVWFFSVFFPYCSLGWNQGEKLSFWAVFVPCFNELLCFCSQILPLFTFQQDGVSMISKQEVYLQHSLKFWKGVKVASVKCLLISLNVFSHPFDYRLLSFSQEMSNGEP